LRFDPPFVTQEQSEMLYRKQTEKSVDQVFRTSKRRPWHTALVCFTATTSSRRCKAKGFELANECRVLEVCNTKQASEVLAIDMALNMALPCRISIYEDGGKTIVGMIPPTAVLKLVSDDPRIEPAARLVEETMEKIIDSAL